MNDVFISYTNESKFFADNIVAAMAKQKIRCWYIPYNIIGDYEESTVKAIYDSKVFILLLSSKASHSPFVLKELTIALQLQKEKSILILPVKMDSYALSKPMENLVGSINWIDAVKEGMDNSIDQLVEIVKAIV